MHRLNKEKHNDIKAHNKNLFNISNYKRRNNNLTISNRVIQNVKFDWVSQQIGKKQSRTVARYQKFKRTSQIYERTHAPIGEKNKNGEVKE